MSSKKHEQHEEDPQPQKKVKTNEEPTKQDKKINQIEKANDSSFVDDGDEEEDILQSDSMNESDIFRWRDFAAQQYRFGGLPKEEERNPR